MSFPQDPPASGSSSDLRREPREHMFDKVVTPSDVGKLNRLVIPKQHAEKYFPLDSAASDKGLLLNFEDRNGKPWRFRYSYWNSSQSYVMTKGWSRFVKEKKLDAGDVVSFQRGLGELAKDRLFIDWRRRPDAPPDLPHHFSSAFHYRPHHTPWAPFLHHPPPTSYQYSHFPAGNPYGVVNGNPCPPGSIMYLRGGRDVFPAAPQIPIQQNMVFESVPVVQGKATAKRLRLFGVNMDFPISGDSDNNNNNECDISAATTMPFDSSSSSSSSSLARLRQDSDIDKGKGSLSLDLDI